MWTWIEQHVIPAVTAIAAIVAAVAALATARWQFLASQRPRLHVHVRRLSAMAGTDSFYGMEIHFRNFDRVPLTVRAIEALHGGLSFVETRDPQTGKERLVDWPEIESLPRAASLPLDLFCDMPPENGKFALLTLHRESPSRSILPSIASRLSRRSMMSHQLAVTWDWSDQTTFSRRMIITITLPANTRSATDKTIS